MLGFLMVARLLYRRTAFGRFSHAVNDVMRTTDVFIKGEKLKNIEREQELGINRAQRRWEDERYGGVHEALRPYAIEEEDLPEVEMRDGSISRPLSTWDITGAYLFKLSEYNALMRWLEMKTAVAAGHKVGPFDADGFWLLHIGRERWNDETLRRLVMASTPSVEEKMDA